MRDRGGSHLGSRWLGNAPRVLCTVPCLNVKSTNDQHLEHMMHHYVAWEAPDNMVETERLLLQVAADHTAPLHPAERHTLHMAANALGRIRMASAEGPGYPTPPPPPRPSTHTTAQEDQPPEGSQDGGTWEVLQPTAKQHARPVGPPRPPEPPPAPPLAEARPPAGKRKFAETEYGLQLVNMDSMPYQKRKMLLQNKLKQFVDEGELGRARALIEEAHAAGIPGLNAQKFNWLVLAYVQARQPEAAACFVERMEPEFGVKPSQRTFVHVVDGFAAAGDMESAMAWYNKMQEGGFDPDIRSLNNMIKACCRAPDVDPDLSIAESWLQQVDRFGLQPDSHTYGNLIAGSAKRRDVHAAVQWFDQMLSRGIEPCLEVCTMAFDAAAAAHAEHLEVGKTFAESVLEIMRDANVTGDSHCWNQFVRVVGHERANELKARQ